MALSFLFAELLAVTHPVITFFQSVISGVSKVGEMHEHGMCTIGRLSRVTMNSSYYNFLSNGIEVNANNGVVVNPSKIDSLFPIVYVRTAPQEGYLVNYKGDLSKYKYGDDVCCELCSEIKSKISYWDM